MDTSAVIVCAGNSTRMQGKNKILLPLGDKLVIGAAMSAFQNCESVREIVIVAREQDIPAINKEAERLGISKLAACTAGGLRILRREVRFTLLRLRRSFVKSFILRE